MENIRIDKALYEDRDKINCFFERVLRYTFETNGIKDAVELLNEEIEDKRLYLEQSFKTKGQERCFLIAKIDEEIIASIEYGPSDDFMNECTNGELSHMPEVGTVFVHPDYHRRGIGKAMLRAMFNELSNRGIYEVCFDSGYQTAQKIWLKKFGEPAYLLKDYWGEDWHHMVWIIDVEKERIKETSDVTMNK